MRRRVIVLVVLAFLLLVNSCNQAQPPEESKEPEAPANQLVGVWSVTERTTGVDEPETVSPAQPGLYIFTKGHYSAVFVTGIEARKASRTSFEPSDEEKVAQHETIIVNAGTYTIDGDVITFKPIVAKIPEFMGGESRSKFDIKDDVLSFKTISLKAADGSEMSDAAGSMKLKRVE